MQHGLYQSALLFTLQSMLCMAKGVEVVCLVNKVTCALIQIMNTMTSKVNNNDEHIVLMDSMMTDI